MTAPSRLAVIPLAAPQGLEGRHRQALALGGSETGSSEQEERAWRPLLLMTLAGNRVPDIAHLAGFLQQHTNLGMHEDNPFFTELLAGLRARTAGAVRLVQRALEVHARDVGYRTDRWVERALEIAAVIVDEAHHPRDCDDAQTPFGLARDAARHLGRAEAATEADRLGVPDSLASAQACFLVLYLWAGVLLED
jgi:hypothetical protein